MKRGERNEFFQKATIAILIMIAFFLVILIFQISYIWDHLAYTLKLP